VIGVTLSVRSKYASAARKWNTPEKALKIIIIMFFTLMLLNSWLFTFPKPENASTLINETMSDTNITEINIIYCSLEWNDDLIPKEYLTYWTIIDLSLNVLIPFAIMIICSVIIVIGIINSTKNISIRNMNKKKNNIINNNNTNNNNTLLVPKSNSSASSVRFKTSKESNSDGQTQISMVKRMSATFYLAVSSKARNVSAMLTINNVIFITLTLPIVVCLFEISSMGGFISFAPYKRAKVNLVKVICIILMNTNCTINIFVYSLMASEFRRHLYNILRKLFCFKLNTQLISSSTTAAAKPSATKSKSIVRRSTLVITNGGGNNNNNNNLEDTGIRLTES
jgi:hypothetical protein